MDSHSRSTPHSPSQAEKWYLNTGASKVGPYSVDDIRGLLSEGEIRPDQKVTTESLKGQWITVSELLTIDQGNNHSSPPTRPENLDERTGLIELGTPRPTDPAHNLLDALISAKHKNSEPQYKEDSDEEQTVSRTVSQMISQIPASYLLGGGILLLASVATYGIGAILKIIGQDPSTTPPVALEQKKATEGNRKPAQTENDSIEDLQRDSSIEDQGFKNKEDSAPKRRQTAPPPRPQNISNPTSDSPPAGGNEPNIVDVRDENPPAEEAVPVDTPLEHTPPGGGDGIVDAPAQDSIPEGENPDDRAPANEGDNQPPIDENQPPEPPPAADYRDEAPQVTE